MTECLFCKINAREIPSEIVYEDEQVLVFKDINPLAPVHLLVISKKHIDDLNGIQEEDERLLGHLMMVIKEMAKEHGVQESGYRVITNIGEDGGQIIKHLHFHIIGGKALGSKLG